MFRKYINFVRGVSINRVGLTGVVLTTSSFFLFSILELARLAGILTNAYLGLITYLLFPALFVVGLILIPIGWRLSKKATGRTTRELLDGRFAEGEIRGAFYGSKVFTTIAIFTLANIIILGAASSRMLHFMDEPVFCGTACHSVMNPEWVTYQVSPHARVRCVDCHVGEGVDALIDSKLNGMWQMISITFDLLQRPIPTPVHQLRPARETCEKCHWPDKFYGSRLKSIARYAMDEKSTPGYNTLNLKVDINHSLNKAGIHWHVSEDSRVTYSTVSNERKKMTWVEVNYGDGSSKRYVNRAVTDTSANDEAARVMDCVDCHNRATHIYEDPHDAVDERMRQGLLDRSLPFLKREALTAITGSYADSAAAMEGIANSLAGFYRLSYPNVALQRSDGIDSAVMVLQSVYSRNIHHGMNISWGSYASQIGHRGPRQGCFRCHNSDLVAADSTSISYDCSLCHSILAFQSPAVFQYLEPTDSTSREYRMHQYLQQEFLDYLKQ